MSKPNLAFKITSGTHKLGLTKLTSANGRFNPVIKNLFQGNDERYCTLRGALFATEIKLADSIYVSLKTDGSLSSGDFPNAKPVDIASLSNKHWRKMDILSSRVEFFEFRHMVIRVDAHSTLKYCSFYDCEIVSDVGSDFLFCKFAACTFSERAQGKLENCAIFNNINNKFTGDFAIDNIQGIGDRDNMRANNEAFIRTIRQTPFNKCVRQVEQPEIVYKKVWAKKPNCSPTKRVIQLELPVDTWVVYAAQNSEGKMRADQAIARPANNIGECYSDYDSRFKYPHGKLLKPRQAFSFDFGDVCSSGIHFFRTRKEALAYNL